MTHKFVVGQKVDLLHRALSNAARGQYEVRRLLPASDRDLGDPCYRIKSSDETHERVAQESELVPSNLAPSTEMSRDQAVPDLQQ